VEQAGHGVHGGHDDQPAEAAVERGGEDGEQGDEQRLSAPHGDLVGAAPLGRSCRRPEE